MMLTIPHFNFPSCPVCDAPLVSYEVGKGRNENHDETIRYACGCRYRFGFDPTNLDSFQNLEPCPEAQAVAMELKTKLHLNLTYGKFAEPDKKPEESESKKTGEPRQLEAHPQEDPPEPAQSIGPLSSEEDIHRWQEGLIGVAEPSAEVEQSETFQKSPECFLECTDFLDRCTCEGACNVCHR